MHGKREKRRGMIAFGLLLLAAFVLLAVIFYAFGGETLTSLLSRTRDVDARGYLSDYDARMGVQALYPTPTSGIAATNAAPAATETADRDIVTVPPAQPERPNVAR